MFAVFGYHAFFFTAHQVNIELCDTCRFQRFKLFDMRFNRAENAKTVDDIVADEIEMPGVLIGMFVIIIAFAAFDIGCKAAAGYSALSIPYFSTISAT